MVCIDMADSEELLIMMQRNLPKHAYIRNLWTAAPIRLCKRVAWSPTAYCVVFVILIVGLSLLSSIQRFAYSCIVQEY